MCFTRKNAAFIQNILIAIGTVVLSLSTAAVKLERGKSGTYGNNYHTFAYGFPTFLD